MTQPPNITYTFPPASLLSYQGYRLAMRKPRNKLEVQTLDPTRKYVYETGLTP